MITAGIDVGAKTIKAVICRDDSLVGRAKVLAGLETRQSAEEALGAACEQAGIARDDIGRMVATGSGRKDITFANDMITEVGACALGALSLNSTTRTAIDVGAEQGRAIRFNKKGKVVDFAINEKCAAGSGAFAEAVARALEIPLGELGPLSLISRNEVPMNAQCAVFAESEVVSLVHSKTSKEDIARAVHDAIASRIISMVRKVGFEREVMLVGGMACNAGFVASMKRGLKMDDLIVPENPEYVGALGAAVSATQVE